MLKQIIIWSLSLIDIESLEANFDFGLTIVLLQFLFIPDFRQCKFLHFDQFHQTNSKMANILYLRPPNLITSYLCFSFLPRLKLEPDKIILKHNWNYDFELVYRIRSGKYYTLPIFSVTVLFYSFYQSKELIDIKDV